MASTTLNLSANTWYAENDSTNHSSATLLRTSRRMTYPSSSGVYNFITVLQFIVPSSLKYKRFTSARVKYYSQCITNGYLSNDYWYSGMDAAPYYADGQAPYRMTGSSIDSDGVKGDWKNVEQFVNSRNRSYPCWRYADITDFFASNIYDDSGTLYFTVLLAGAPIPIGTARDYGEIFGIGTANAAQLELTYEDQTQLPPTPSYPAGTYVNENTDILFAWAWNSSTAATQASVQLEYKLKTAGSWTTVSLTQTGHTYLLSGGLPQGTYKWRIKGTNDAGETSDYSETAEFNVVGKPAAPTINAVPNRTLTEITWNTTDQNAFDVTLTDANGKVLINESVASSASSYKPNVFLKGNYTVGIRTRNSTGLTSDWSYKAFSITAAGPAKPSMRLLQNDAQVFISITAASGIQYAVVRKEDREGAEEKVLGTINGESFMDATFGFDIPYRYVVRAWSTGGYTDSDPERICYPKSAIVLETDEDEIIIDTSEETFLPYAEDISGDMAIFNCVGRELPIVEQGEYESRIFRSRLYIREDQKERLAAMAKKTRIFYRDYSGRAFPVAIQPPLNLDRYFGDGYIADIQFVRISETEVVVNV